MRKVRHRNVVQFIGACTQKPNLCIVFEFMAGGSIFDHMRKVGGLCNAQGGALLWDSFCCPPAAMALAAALPVITAEERVAGEGAPRQLFHPISWRILVAVEVVGGARGRTQVRIEHLILE